MYVLSSPIYHTMDVCGPYLSYVLNLALWMITAMDSTKGLSEVNKIFLKNLEVYPQKKSLPQLFATFRKMRKYWLPNFLLQKGLQIERFENWKWNRSMLISKERQKEPSTWRYSFNHSINTCSHWAVVYAHTCGWWETIEMKKESQQIKFQRSWGKISHLEGGHV